MGYLIALHTLAAVIWVGGMFFAYMALRPAAASVLEPAQRAPLWCQTLTRFFAWVWAAIAVLLVTGLTTLFLYFNGMAGAGWHIHVMIALGVVMMLLFMHVWFAPFRRLKQAVAANDIPEAGRRIGQIRRFVGINLILGLIVIVVASGGRYVLFG